MDLTVTNYCLPHVFSWFNYYTDIDTKIFQYDEVV